MNCAQTRLKRLNRPKLLVDAAQHVLSNYNRNNMLRHIFQLDVVPPPGKALDVLLQREDEADTARRAGMVA